MSTEKLSVKEKVGYALGDSASNFYWKMFEYFLMFFYTDVFGISAATAGTMFGVTRLWDAINDPLMGAVADRTKTRWGKFRPYLLWLAIPMVAAGVLTFSTPDLDEDGKVIYAYVTYILMMMTYTAINIPYSALMGVMTSDTQDRTSLSSYRFVGAFTAGTFVVFTTKKFMVPWLGGGDAALGWQLTMLVWGLIAAGMFITTFLTTKERVEPTKAQKANLGAELKDLLGNGPWLVMFLLGMLVITMFWIRGATTLYYFKYFVQDESLFEYFMTLGTVANIIGIAATGPLTRFFGSKHRLYMILMGSSALLTGLFYIIPPDQIVLIFVLNGVINLILGPNAPLVWAMYADTADYGEWKSGRRATGLVFSAATFSQKLGGAVAGSLAGWSLTLTGYVANQDQTPEALNGILMLFSFVPACIGIIAALAVMMYKLDDKRMQEIEADLLKRRQENGETPAPA